jgi:hypothetical protein
MKDPPLRTVRGRRRRRNLVDPREPAIPLWSDRDELENRSKKLFKGVLIGEAHNRDLRRDARSLGQGLSQQRLHRLLGPD